MINDVLREFWFLFFNTMKVLIFPLPFYYFLNSSLICFWGKIAVQWLISLLQQGITWYKIHHAEGQAQYYSSTRTIKQRPVKLDWLRPLYFNAPVWE